MTYKYLLFAGCFCVLIGCTKEPNNEIENTSPQEVKNTDTQSEKNVDDTETIIGNSSNQSPINRNNPFLGEYLGKHGNTTYRLILHADGSYDLYSTQNQETQHTTQEYSWITPNQELQLNGLSTKHELQTLQLKNNTITSSKNSEIQLHK